MQRDYIMRLIEQIAALMASIIAKERAGKYPEACLLYTSDAADE